MFFHSDDNVFIPEDVVWNAVDNWDPSSSCSLVSDNEPSLDVDLPIDDREDFDMKLPNQDGRFGPRTTKKDLKKLQASRVPANTLKNTHWVLQFLTPGRIIGVVAAMQSRISVKGVLQI